LFIENFEKGVKEMALIFVTGGAKSGKSKFAEELILNLNNGKQENVNFICKNSVSIKIRIGIKN